MPAKLCAGCQTRPRRYICLRCGDALCRRCVAARACCGANVERDIKPPDIFEQLCGINSVLRGTPETSSAAPLTPEDPPPAALSETPSTSTTPRLPADAGGGRAVPEVLPQPRSDLEAEMQRRDVPESATCIGPSSVKLRPRARGPVPGQHTSAAAFFADKPALPKARAPVVPERGARHG